MGQEWVRADYFGDAATGILLAGAGDAAPYLLGGFCAQDARAGGGFSPNMASGGGCSYRLHGDFALEPVFRTDEGVWAGSSIGYGANRSS